MGLLQTLVAPFQARNFRRQSVVVSRPFFANGKWQMLSGDVDNYLTLSFDNLTDADRQFRLVGVLAGCGDILYDFVVLDEAAAISVDGLDSYRHAIGAPSGAQDRAG